MAPKPISEMTSLEFIEYKAALGFNRKAMAEALGVRGPTVTGYENNKNIPVWVVERLHSLIDAEREKIKAQDGVLINLKSGLGSMIVHQNTRKRPVIHQALGRFGRRQRKPDTHVLPVYRLTHQRMGVYLAALVKWQARVLELSRTYGDEARQRDYRLEMMDIRSLADTSPRKPPYDVLIERGQWDVVSRALRHMALEDPRNGAQALRLHWNKHRHAGYLGWRKKPIPNTKEQP